MSYWSGWKIIRAKEDLEAELQFPGESLEAGPGVVEGEEEKRFPARLFLLKAAGNRAAVLAAVAHPMYSPSPQIDFPEEEAAINCAVAFPMSQVVFEEWYPIEKAVRVTTPWLWASEVVEHFPHFAAGRVGPFPLETTPIDHVWQHLRPQSLVSLPMLQILPILCQMRTRKTESWLQRIVEEEDQEQQLKQIFLLMRLSLLLPMVMAIVVAASPVLEFLHRKLPLP